MKTLTTLMMALFTAAALTACVDQSDDEQGTSDNPSEGASIQMQDKATDPVQDESDSTN
ncbi:hypothetical protein [Phytohalomonas tamaricis]|uniref:hypothetical protein n=1 Tax=Phytohalomonas tamaricis TaxID=2081032 RepID=UPI00131A1FE4|nr:hypothetical protein [Phytohalomonas tamaricis]